MPMPQPASQQSFPPLVPSHSDELRCPKCDQPLFRLTGAQGSFITTCPNKLKVAPGRQLDHSALKSRDHCGQKLHVLAIEGVAIVLPLSNEQFAKYQKAYPGAAAIYAAVGVIPTRPGEEYVPSHPCRVCRTVTKLYQLHGGKCAACVAALEAAGKPE